MDSLTTVCITGMCDNMDSCLELAGFCKCENRHFMARPSRQLLRVRLGCRNVFQDPALYLWNSQAAEIITCSAFHAFHLTTAQRPPRPAPPPSRSRALPGPRAQRPSSSLRVVPPSSPAELIKDYTICTNPVSRSDTRS